MTTKFNILSNISGKDKIIFIIFKMSVFRTFFPRFESKASPVHNISYKKVRLRHGIKSVAILLLSVYRV